MVGEVADEAAAMEVVVVLVGRTVVRYDEYKMSGRMTAHFRFISFAERPFASRLAARGTMVAGSTELG